MKLHLLLIFLLASSLISAQNTLMRGEVYDFNVGDEFQYSFDNYPGTMVDRFVVISKQVSLNADTVTYKMYKSHYFNDPNGNHFQEDTISRTYTDLLSPVTTFGDSSYVYDFQQDSSYYYYPDTILEFDTELCGLEINGWDSYPPVFEPVRRIYLYGRGVGVVRRYQYDQTNFGNQEIENYNLYYYKKGNTTCGSPVTASISLEEPGEGSIRLYPNPAKGFVIVELNRESVLDEISVFDSHGRAQSVDYNQTGDRYYLNTLNLSDGIYSIVFKLKSRVIRKTISIIH